MSFVFLSVYSIDLLYLSLPQHGIYHTLYNVPLHVSLLLVLQFNVHPSA